MAFGEVTAKIGGKVRGMRFNLNCRYEFCKMHGLTEDQVQEYFMNRLNVDAIRDMVYCALRAADLAFGNPIDYNQYVVGEWISEMPQEEFERIVIGGQDANVNQSKEVSKKKSSDS